jgi:hypothetical protein
MTAVLRRHTETEGRGSYEDRARNKYYISISQGTPKDTSSQQKLGKGTVKIIPQASWRNQHCSHLDFRLLTSGTVRKINLKMLSL